MRFDTNFAILDIPEYKGPGIYALIDDSGRMYIGSSVNIQRRVRSHNTYLRYAMTFGHTGFENPHLIKSIHDGPEIRCRILLKTDNLDLSRKELYLLEGDYIKTYGKTNQLLNVRPMKAGCQI